MDSHSLHEFMIRYGQTLNSTPEFMSYQRVYAAVWPVLAELILQLEGICAEYAIPLVVVDGKVRCFGPTVACRQLMHAHTQTSMHAHTVHE